MSQISKRIKSILLISLIIFLGGCSGNSYYYYSTNHFPEATPAAIKPWYEETYYFSSESLDVFPIFIDGKITETYHRDDMPSYFILRGEHIIRIALSANDGIRREASKPIIFKAKAGHTYLTKAIIEKELNQDGIEMEVKTSFWIEDENTGEVVSDLDL